jgi:hypothetical protein
VEENSVLRKLLFVVFALLLCVGWWVPLPVSADTPGVYYVASEGSDEFGDGSPVWIDTDNSTGWSTGDRGPWRTIQHAVASVTGGDTIKVMAGTYDLTTPVKITKPLTVTGNTNAPSSVIINAPQTGAAPFVSDKDCFQVLADNITIEGFRIQGAHLVWPGVGDGWQNAGIAVGGDPAMIGGISTPLIGIQRTVIRNNEITGNSYGIHAYRAQHLTISNNLIYANTQDGNWSGKGLLFYSQVWPGVDGDPNPLIQTYDIDIINNRIYDNELMGIEFNDTDGIHGDLNLDVLIDGNVFYNNGGPWDALGYPFDVFRGISTNGTYDGSETGVTISNNEFYGHWSIPGPRFSSGSAAIRAYNARNWTISNNRLHHNLAGIRFSGSLTAGNQVTGNQIHDNAQGIRIEAGLNTTAFYNQVYSNNNNTYTANDYPPYGILNLSSVLFDASMNWWGQAGGPTYPDNQGGQGDNISAKVAWDPWYTSPELTILASRKPVHNITRDSYHDTIQAAVDAAFDGDTITVAAGVYDENIDIKHSVTLIGAGSDNITGTILQNTKAPALIAGSPYSYKPVVIISASGIEGSPLTIKNLRIQTHKDNVTDAQLPGVLPRSGNQVSWLELDNVCISGTRSSGTAESGILLDDYSSLDHLVINDCVFENMAYGIIFFNNSNTGTNARHIDINRSTFNRNSIKGFYAEKLSDAIFNKVTVTDNGNTTLAPNWATPNNAGIDINLKYGDYANLTFNELTVTGNGIGSTNGAGLTIKARGTGADSSYNSRPASLALVTVSDGTFSGNEVGLRFGEIGKNNTGPTNITVHHATICDNSQFNISNVINGSTIDATGNWWGTTEAAAISPGINGAVTWDPWHLKPLSNLTVESLANDSLVLRWAAGGVWAGDYYDFRIATSPLDNPAAWDKAEQLAGKPSPNDSVQEMFIRRLKSNTRYYFGLALISDKQRTDISCIDALTLDYKPVDTTPPAAVTDLSLSPGSPAATTVVLSWTAVGDDGNTGFVSRYIVKQSTSPIDAVNFDAATSVFYNHDIKPAGQSESFTVARLRPGTQYYFAVKALDEVKNTSLISNVANTVTADILPVVSGISPTAGDNGQTRTITISGANFSTSGSTTVRLLNNNDILTLKDVGVSSSTSLTAVLPKGGPPGTYYARITNSNGTSDLGAATYVISSTSQPLPVVTNIVPSLVPSHTPFTQVQVYGRNLTGATSVTLGNVTATIVSADNDNRIVINTPGLDPGEYDIQATTIAGNNEVSSVKFIVTEPIVLDSNATQDIATSGIVQLGSDGTIPVQVTLTTDDREEAARNTSNDAGISVVIPPGTIVTDISGLPYSGTLDPPRVVKPDTLAQASLPGDAVVIEMGNSQQTVTFNRDFTATVTITASTPPSIYYFNKSRNRYELAGKTGTLDGIDYLPGGTVLNQADGTYTISLLLDHMSVYIASTRSLLPVPPPNIPAVNYLTTEFFGTRALFSLDSSGRILVPVVAAAADGRLSLTLSAGTQVFDKNGLPLNSLTAAVNTSPPAASQNLQIIGTAYNFDPTGAVFSPAALLVYEYSQDTLPVGITAEELSWAYYDESTSGWIKLPSVVDTGRSIITAEISHFTTFAVTASQPAVFSSSSLLISPSLVAPGQLVSIQALIANTGGNTGQRTIVLRINSLIEFEKTVDLVAGTFKTVAFTVIREIPGEYQVEIDNLTGTFTVTTPEVPAPAIFAVTDLAIDIAEGRPDSTVTISVKLDNTGGSAGIYNLALQINGAIEEEKNISLAAGENRTVIFCVTRNHPGIYQVEVGGLSGRFTVSAAAGENYWLYALAGAVLLAVIIMGILLVIRRRRIV